MSKRHIACSAIGLKICTIAPSFKKYKSKINKKKTKHDKIVLLAKSKLNDVKALINSVIMMNVC